jgi:hypothetical protein
MKRDSQWPGLLVTRHSLAPSAPETPAPRRVPVTRRRVERIRAKQELPRVAILTRRRPLPKGH